MPPSALFGDRLAEAILRLLDDENLSRAIEEAGQVRAVKLFSFDKVADDLLEHYQNLLQLNKGRLSEKQNY